MLFRWLASYFVLVIIGLMLRQMAIEAGRELSVLLSSPLIAFMHVTGIKRGHDMDYSGWAILFLSLLPILLLLPRTKEPNRFGPAPTRWL